MQDTPSRTEENPWASVPVGLQRAHCEYAWRELFDELIDWRFRSLPPRSVATPLGKIADHGWNVLSDDLQLPALLVKDRALRNNIEALASFCTERGLFLAPHVKTPMAPQIFQRQLEAGAWGLTAATVAQAAVLREFGVGRILIANNLVEPSGIRWLVEELASDPAFDAYCFVDSPEAAEIMSALATDAPRDLKVLVELGIPGGRTGCRTHAEVAAVSAAVAALPGLALSGVSAWDGLWVKDALTIAEKLELVDELVARVSSAAGAIDEQRAFVGDDVVISIGTTAFFDRVAASLQRRLPSGRDPTVVLRCGGYITHDPVYWDLSPFDGRATSGTGGPRFESAMELCARVQSRPEPDLAVVGFGRRDAPTDAGLPTPLFVFDQSTRRRDAGSDFAVTALHDHHAIVRLPRDDKLAVGDIMGFGVFHSCTAFDRWPLVLVVDDAYRVTAGIRTFF